MMTEIHTYICEHGLQIKIVTADEVIHIGDSLSSDVKGANSLGIRALWLNRFGKEIPEGVESITSLLGAFEVIKNE